MAASAQLKSATELFGLPPPPKTGRERLVATAVDLFYRNGFGAVGLDEVISAAGVTKTTFYKHFEGKDDLMVAAVHRREEWEGIAWDRAVRKLGGDDPVGQLLAMLDVLDLWFNDPEFLGCMFLNAASEFPNPHDPVHRAAAAFKQRARDHYRDLASAAGADPPNAETFADCFTAMIEGALILRQTHGRNDAARVVRPMVEQLIATHLPGSSTKLKTRPSKPRSREKRTAANRTDTKRASKPNA